MADDNRPLKPAWPAGRYMRYAIGEIVLVVVGILFALYINQWNGVRLDIVYEKKMLSEIQKDLHNEVLYLNLQKESTIERVKKISLLDSLLKEKTPIYNKFLDTLFGAVWGLHLYPMDNKAKYENLKSRGLNVVQVDSIKEQLMYVYEELQPRLESLNDLEYDVNSAVFRPYYMKNFSNLHFRQSATPVDFESVWKDHEYHNIVSLRLKTLRGNQIDMYENCIEQMEYLQKMIANYLNREN